MSGGLDWIWRVPSDQAERLRAMANLTVKSSPTMRIGYLSFDSSARHGESPMNDLLVRKAVAHAIDRQGIVDALLGEGSSVVHSACFPTQVGCTEDVVRYDYDPTKARELLAEAGYPDGFEIPFYAYRDRTLSEAIIADLDSVGIRAQFSYLKYAALKAKVLAGEVPFQFMTWGSYEINDASAITSHFFRGGKDDYARDPRVIEWLEIADTSTDVEVRKANYKKALQRIAEQAYWLPLWSYNVTYVFTDEVNFEPTADEIPRFFTMSWK
jgi:peptide/nickel transport system substrate-binding protein